MHVQPRNADIKMQLPNAIKNIHRLNNEKGRGEAPYGKRLTVSYTSLTWLTKNAVNSVITRK